MKRFSITVLILLCVVLTFSQEECKDIVYPTDGEEIIFDCCITAVKYGNVVFFKKDGKTQMIPALAIKRDGDYIELRKNKSSQNDDNQLETIENRDHIIGDQYQGGIVFFVDHTGLHGLVAAPHDQTTKKVSWGYKGITNALSTDDGQANCDKILSFHNSYYNNRGVYCAARYCDTLSIGGYRDWYLPAIDELKMMYDHRIDIGRFLAGDYCSSTEYGKKDAYSVHFKPGKRAEFYYNKIDRDYFVRCIRKF